MRFGKTRAEDLLVRDLAIAFLIAGIAAIAWATALSTSLGAAP